MNWWSGSCAGPWNRILPHARAAARKAGSKFDFLFTVDQVDEWPLSRLTTAPPPYRPSPAPPAAPPPRAVMWSVTEIAARDGITRHSISLGAKIGTGIGLAIAYE